GIADPERLVLDQDALVFDRAATLVLYVGAEAADVGDGELEGFLVGIGSRPGALIELGVDGYIFGLARNAQSRGLVVGRQDAHDVGHETLREPATPSDPARQARRDIAVNVDQRFQFRRIRIDL